MNSEGTQIVTLEQILTTKELNCNKTEKTSLKASSNSHFVFLYQITH